MSITFSDQARACTEGPPPRDRARSFDPLGTPLILEAILGPPIHRGVWVGERDAVAMMNAIGQRVPRVVALSGHDSTPWTDQQFAARCGDAYRLLRAGKNSASRRRRRPRT
jgi:hypothetical protein